MGGDHGPGVTVPGALAALGAESDLHVLLVGLREPIEELLRDAPAQLRARIRVHEATQVVGMDEKPQDALRRKKDSSMRVAIDLVKAGEAAACVSAGNTGALMATGRFVLKTIDGIDRPAIISRIRARHGHTHMLDLGANSECTAEHLLQFAVMGSVVASDMHGIAKPRVGILNIGSEEMKGDSIVQDAAKLVSASKLNYVGFVEGDGIFHSDVDVVVSDGFVGNVALKTMEGVARLMTAFLKEEFRRSLLRGMQGLVARSALEALGSRLDPRRYNGASLVGLNGIVLKSHGSADQFAFENAVKAAIVEARKGVPLQIGKLVENRPH